MESKMTSTKLLNAYDTVSHLVMMGGVLAILSMSFAGFIA